MTAAPIRKVALGSRTAIVTPRADGCTLLRSPDPLGSYPRALTDHLRRWANEAPGRVFMAKRDANGRWRALTYADTYARVRRIGQALIDRKLSPERPIAILSGNDLEHALLALAAMHVGVPYAPISPNYSLISTDFGKLKHILALLTPGLVFCATGERFAKAIAATVDASVELVVTELPPSGREATLFSALETTPATAAVERAHDAIGPDSVAKLLFTSGSTGMPKGVINTQRMLCSNLQMIVQNLPLFAAEPPVIVDWLPWNHTFGGNHNIGLMLANGGTMYLSDGNPTPALFERTVLNLREIAPTLYFDVPKGFELLVPYLRREPELRRTFFSRLKMMFYAGAGLAQHVWDALDELSVDACGERILMITGLGSTETAPFAVCANWEAGRSGLLGLPAPGLDLKLAPTGGKLEARVRGPNITPGYWRQPELTRAAFDDEGYYRMGDAVRFVDPRDPQKGLEFDGRIAEDFKLSTGTWVSVGALRTRIIAEGAPFVQDAVIAGHDRDDIAVLIFPNLEACRGLCQQLAADASATAVLAHAAVRDAFQAMLDRLALASTGSANRVARLLVLDTPPAVDRHEITDKGSINQRAVLTHRAALVDELYAERCSAHVLVAATQPRAARAG
jgi:feruloyl-CoA synthase